MMEWILCGDRRPTKEDSPILASMWAADDVYCDEYCLKVIALYWTDGYRGETWYDHSDEYSMQDEDMEWWMPLPLPPKSICAGDT